MSHRPLRALGFGLAVVALGIGAAEGLARRLEPTLVPDLTAPTAPELILPYHPYLLWEHPPGERIEAGVRVRINTLGLRGPEPTLPKPGGVRRVVATGDSTVYGFGVAEDAMFVQVATELLRGADAGIEGWTAAVPGYSTLQTLNLLQLRALRLEPDVIVIANMWSDHQEAALADEDLIEQAARFDQGWGGRIDRLLRTTALYRIAWWRLVVEGGERAERRRSWKGPQQRAGEAPPQVVTRVPPNAYAWNLEALVDLAHDHGAPVVFLLLPHPEDLPDNDLHPSPSIALYRQIMRDTAARHGAPVVDGGAALRSAGLPSSRLWIDTIHPSAAGHHLLGEALAAALSGWAQGEALEGPGDGRSMPRYDEDVPRPPPYVPPVGER